MHTRIPYALPDQVVGPTCVQTAVSNGSAAMGCVLRITLRRHHSNPYQSYCDYPIYRFLDPYLVTAEGKVGRSQPAAVAAVEPAAS